MYLHSGGPHNWESISLFTFQNVQANISSFIITHPRPSVVFTGLPALYHTAMMVPKIVLSTILIPTTHRAQ